MTWLPDLWKVVSRLASLAEKYGYDKFALSLCRAYSKLRPKDPHAWILLSEFDWSRGDRPQAEATLRRGLKRGQESVELWCRLGAALVGQGRLEEAEEILAKTRSRFPDSPKPLLGLASVSLQKGDWEEVISSCNAAERKISDWDDLSGLAAILIQLPNQRDRAEEILRRVEKNSKGSADHLVMLGVLLQEKGDPTGESYLRKARRYWRGPMDQFERYVALCRRSIASADGPAVGQSP